ncbi:MAG: winged helix-turn-helix domain-containing protein [Spirochaetaceae bacterium]|nr:winged helix-turn-helix domain-containing protein [Spirochaetaceae bacterium]
MNLILYSLSTAIRDKFAEEMQKYGYGFFYVEHVYDLEKVYKANPIDLIVMAKPEADMLDLVVFKTFTSNFQKFCYLIIDLSKTYTETILRDKIADSITREHYMRIEPLIKIVATVFGEEPHEYKLLKSPYLSKPMKKLLELFLLKRGLELSIEDMSLHIWQEVSESRTNTLYAYIHALRRELADDLKNPTKLIRCRKGAYKLV